VFKDLKVFKVHLDQPDQQDLRAFKVERDLKVFKG
jgi:hypothetical protein